MKVRRRTIKQLSIHRRYAGITALSRLKIQAIKKRIVLLIALRRKFAFHPLIYQKKIKIIQILLASLLIQYHNLVFFDPGSEILLRRRLSIRKVVTVFDFPIEKIRENFRFNTHQQLLDIIKFFELPENVYLNNGCMVSAQIVLMVALFKFHFPENYNDMENLFGYEYTLCSRIFNFFLNFMIENWGYLLLNNFQYWKQSFPHFARAIQQRKLQLGVDDPFSEMESYANSEIIGFLDATYFFFCQPDNQLLQQSVYTGYKKQFGVKFQVAVLPNGMKLHVHYAESARRHDSFILSQSNLLENLAVVQEHSPIKYRLHGDPAYGASPPFLSSGGLGPVRVLIEQDFGEDKELFKYVTYKRAMQLGCEQVVKIFFVSFLLHDIYIIFNGSKVATSCNVVPPSCEDYVSQGRKQINLSEN